MELSRQEYPALLRSLSPNQAVSVLEDRVRLIGKVNLDIADWLSERRRIEEVYVQGLRRLANRRLHDASADLGIFRTPWQSIVGSMQTLAESHAVLASKMELDIERPLRDYGHKNREMQGMTTIQGNLASIAKEVDGAHRKASKLSGSKLSANKVASATSDVEAASQQWDSQAPYVFEQLQSLDENRVNHLRDLLTQLETHEADLVERNRVTVESCLNALLNLDTSEEISTFVARQTSAEGPTTLGNPHASTGTPSLRSASVRPSTSAAAPPTTTPSRSQRVSDRGDVTGNGASPYSTTSKTTANRGPPPKSGFGGLRRLGTVLGRQNKGSKGMDRPSSPEKRSRGTRNPLRRGPSSNMQAIPSPPDSSSHLPLPPPQPTPPTNQVSSTQPIDRPQQPQERQQLNGRVNGDTIQPAPMRVSSLPATNGTSTNRGEPPEQGNEPEQVVAPTGPPPERDSEPETQRDAEGYSVPSSAVDEITRAQQEAGLSGDPDQPQFKLAIRSEATKEQDPDAQSAFSSVANTLRAQASQVATPRKPGTVRGRRDVRNTVFVGPGQSLESAGLGGPPVPAFNLGSMPTLPSVSSDAQSIRSAHSTNSLANPPSISHPQMHQPGLNASVVETVSATFNNSEVTKATVIGEIALQHNPSDSPSPSGSESIRLENFPVLEKVAPNPTFITQVPTKPGEYSVSLSQVARPSVAFKYQVHLEESNLAAHAPISITPSWKVEPTQTSVILSYTFNPAFASPAKRSVSLNNVVVFITIANARALSCQSKPLGTFSKERSLIYWKLGDVTLDGYAETPHKLLARITTDSEAKPGNVEVRWEISGESAAGLGSGLSLSQMKGVRDEGGHDPFADEGTAATATAAGGSWRDVPVTRKLVSGRYIAE